MSELEPQGIEPQVFNCSLCKGSGFKNNYYFEFCKFCGGCNQTNIYCYSCKGNKGVYKCEKVPCYSCRGKGFIKPPFMI